MAREIGLLRRRGSFETSRPRGLFEKKKREGGRLATRKRLTETKDYFFLNGEIYY
jgi:hypothetical protein